MSIKKLDNGKYELRMRLQPNPATGKRANIKRIFDRKRDAEEFKEQHSGSKSIVGEKLTLREYLADWLEYKKPELEASTYDGYKRYIDKYMLPVLGNYKLNFITPAAIDRFYRDLQSDLSPKSIVQIQRILSGALKRAVFLQHIKMNPCQYITLPKNKEPFKAIALSPEKARELLKGLEGTDLYMPVLLALSLGLRRGEVIGLKWTSVDLTKGIIAIENTRTTAGNAIIEKGPKSESGIRQVSSGPVVADILRRYRITQLGSIMLCGRHYEGEYVCTWKDGKPFTPGSLSHSFGYWTDKLGLPKCRFHDLRHTNTTIQRSAGVDEEIVRQRNGWSSAEMTEHYTHFGIDQQKAATDAINKALF